MSLQLTILLLQFKCRRPKLECQISKCKKKKKCQRI